MSHVTFWHWWIAALVLFVLEAFAPGAIFLWMGVAAGVSGLALYLIPTMGWDYQVLLFALLSVASIIVWRTYLHRHPTATDRPTLNRRGEQYVGRVFTLEEPIVNGEGKIRVDDSTWKVRGQDCPRGSRVRVVGIDGAVLSIESEP